MVRGKNPDLRLGGGYRPVRVHQRPGRHDRWNYHEMEQLVGSGEHANDGINGKNDLVLYNDI